MDIVLSLLFPLFESTNEALYTNGTHGLASGRSMQFKDLELSYEFRRYVVRVDGWRGKEECVCYLAREGLTTLRDAGMRMWNLRSRLLWRRLWG